MLYDSLRDKLLPLADETLVYPAHGAGSLCGKNLSTDTVSTIGVQRQYNYALQPMSRERFIEIITADQPDTPAYFTYDAVLNSLQRPTLHDALERELQPVDLAELLELVSRGGQLLDTRDQAEFEGAHIRGALNIGLDGSFATWCGSLLDPDRPVILVAEPGREIEAATRLGRIGFDTVAGYLRGGMEQLKDAPERIERIERITARSAADRLVSESPPVLVDVRTPPEWGDSHIDAAVNVPLSQLANRLAELPADPGLIVYCASGYRSAIAVSLLRRQGRPDVADLVGGLAAWTSAQLHTVAQ
jgi:rhodanese-related sulfurtransferase